MAQTIKSIFINLPIKDLQKTRAFWQALGFAFNEQFCDDKALCLVLREDSVYAMLITPEFYATFTPRPLADGSTTQVLLAIAVDSRAMVDELVQKAVKQGAKRYLAPQDDGWMYYDRFEDLDGHQWEVLYADPALLGGVSPSAG